MAKLNVQHAVFSVTWSFRNHSNMMICCSRNISYYYQCWKELCCLIFFVKTVIFLYLMNIKLKRAAFIWNILLFLMH